MMIFRMVVLLVALQNSDAEFARIDEWAKEQPDNGPGKMAVGDAFWKASRKFPKDRLRFVDRASEAWASGWPMLQDVWRDKSRENLRKMFAAPGAVPAIPKVWSVESAVSSPERVRSGRFAARVTMPKDGTLHHLLKATFQVPAGTKTFDVSAWVLTDETNSDVDSLKVVVYGPGGKVLSAVGSPIPTDLPVWTKASVSVPVDGAQKVCVFFEFQSSRGVAFVDDVEVKAGDKILFK